MRGRGKKNKEMKARAIPVLLGLVAPGFGQAAGARALRSHGGPAVGRTGQRCGGGRAIAPPTTSISRIIPYGDKYLLRFDGGPENFVLYGDRVALGGRELKYDTGALALKISVWGGVTLYTQEAPGGLPATRTGDATMPPKLTVPVTRPCRRAGRRGKPSRLYPASETAFLRRRRDPQWQRRYARLWLRYAGQ